ncbi:MAG: hypothetical protein NT039_03070 [Candidatus Berkelbacteria bacterium]|nr:hypothetical protein [Candidatus Berkelbacteria bacterium]
MTSKRKRRPPPYEEAVARRITYEPHEISPELRLYDWGVLTGSPKMTGYRLTVEAVVSAALEPEWPLFEAAHNWIAAQEDKGMLFACALEEAMTTADRRKQVLEHLIDRHEFKLSAPARAIWTATREGKRFGWDEICTACGVERWENPPSQSVALNDACRRIMPDPPSEEVLFARATAMLEESTFEQLPYVQRQLVLVALRPGGGGILEAIRQNFPPFWRAVTATLLDPPRWLTGNVKQEDYLSALYPLAEALADELGAMPERTRQATIDLFLGKPQCPWLWHVAGQLISHTTRWERVPSFLAHSIFYDLGELAYRNEESIEVMRDRAREYAGNLPDIIRQLPDVVAAELMKLLVTDDSDHRFDDRWNLVGDAFAERIEASPAPYVAALQPVAQSGKMPLSALTVYVSGVGIELARKGLEGWLRHEDGGIAFNKPIQELLTDYVIPGGLAAARLVQDPKDAEELRKLGYELKPEDVADDRVVTRMLLKTGQTSRDSAYEVSSVWHNAIWRDVLFDHANNHEAVLRSALVFAGSLKSPEDMGWVRIHLQPRLEARPELRKCLCQIAWSTAYEQPGGDHAARQLLITQPGWLGWMDDEDRSNAKAYCAAHWEYLGGIPEAVLTPDEYRQIFFDHAIEGDKTFRSSLPSPDRWGHAFPDDQARDRLAVWLLKNEDRIDLDHWFTWVVHFDLHARPEFQRRIRRNIELLDDENQNTAFALLETEAA